MRTILDVPASMFHGIPCLPSGDSDVSGMATFLRKYTEDDLRLMVEHIAYCEPLINPFLESLGLPTNEGPSWWVTDVLPHVRAELERRHRPKRAYTGKSPIALLKQLDLATVAEKYTKLEPAGRGKLKGRCPLHNERTPSFYIYEDSQRWRCFGACATGGDVVNLLQQLRARERQMV